MSKKPIIIRSPGGPSSSNQDWKPPPINWLEGTWHVTHSTLPLWKSKKNVQVTYKSLPSSGKGFCCAKPSPIATSDAHSLDDLVSYQWLNSDKTKTVHGINISTEGGNTSTWNWKGTGWLSLITSHWEVLGWSSGEDSSNFPSPARKQEDWAITYFAKTLFTPAGIDIYSRSESGISPGMVAEIRAALSEVDDVDVKRLVGEIFEIVRDSPQSELAG